LTIRQLLDLNHLAYTISWIRTKIDILDKAQKSNDRGGTVEPTHIHLGSSLEATTVAEFADGSSGPAYATFWKMLETFLNNSFLVRGIWRCEVIKQ